MKQVDEENIYRLNSIIRYNTLNRIGCETVAAHSYFVTFFIHDICTDFKLSDIIRLYSLEAGIFHDVPEVITNDITHDVKELIGGLRALLQPYEEDIIKQYSPRAWKVLFKPETLEERLAHAIVNHADILSVCQYCGNEVDMGNTTFKGLFSDSCMRVSQSREEVRKLSNEYKQKMEEK